MGGVVNLVGWSGQEWAWMTWGLHVQGKGDTVEVDCAPEEEVSFCTGTECFLSLVHFGV